MTPRDSALASRLATVSAIAVVLGACFFPIHIGAKSRNPSFARASVCPDGVAIFDSSSEVQKKYIEVAELIPPPGGFEYHPDPQHVLRAQRKKAAELGANGLIVERGHRRKNGWYDNALAIFIPEDTSRSLAACPPRV